MTNWSEPQSNPNISAGAWHPTYPPIEPQPHRSARVNKKHLIGYGSTALVALLWALSPGPAAPAHPRGQLRR